MIKDQRLTHFQPVSVKEKPNVNNSPSYYEMMYKELNIKMAVLLIVCTVFIYYAYVCVKKLC